jgi:hypothetical protein
MSLGWAHLIVQRLNNNNIESVRQFLVFGCWLVAVNLVVRVYTGGLTSPSSPAFRLQGLGRPETESGLFSRDS